MSNVIKLNQKAGSVKVKLNSDVNELNKANDEDDYFRHQLELHYEKGFRDGQNQVRQELEAVFISQLSEKTDEFNRILAALEANLSEYDQAFDKIVIESAIAIAEKIVKHEISKESIITGTLRDSIKKIIGANEILIRINPADHKEVYSSEGGSPVLDESLAKIKFEIDDKIEPGGCIVETEIGNVDSRILTQINEIKKQLEANFTSQVI